MLFNNHNKEVIRDLARSSLKTDKLNRRFPLITIILSTFMVFSIFLVMKGTDQLHINTQFGKAQVGLNGAAEEKIDKIKIQPDIEWVSQSLLLGGSYQDDISLNVYYEDDNHIEKQKKYSYIGSTPKSKDGVMISKGYLEYFDLNLQPGDNISLDLKGTGEVQDYILSGIIDDKSIGENYKVWVSRDLAKELSQNDEFLVKTYIRLNTELIQSHEILEFANKALEGTGITEGEILLTEYFSVMTGGDRANVMAYVVLFGGIILFLAGIIVYGIFYTSIIKDVRSYGQLRTIGFTKKQVKKMVYKKGFYIACKGIPIGLLVGLIIGFALCPKGFVIKNALVGAVGISIAMIITIRISIMAPVRLASNVSPIEGAKYLAYTGKKKQKKSHYITPLRLALMSISRNKKKTILTIAMLGLSSGILVFTSLLAESIDAEKKARFAYFPDGEIHVLIQRIEKSTFLEGEMYRSTRLQLEDNPLSDVEFVASLKEIDGIEKITPYNAVNLSIVEVTDTHISVSAQDIPSITRDEYSKLQELINTDMDYDTMIEKKGVLISDDKGKIGDEYTLELRAENGNAVEVKVPVIGTYSALELMEEMPIVPATPRCIIPYETLKELTGVSDQTGVLAIDVDDSKIDSVIEELKKIDDDNNNIIIDTITDRISTIESIYNHKSQILYFIAGILFIFGMVSLVNVVLSNMAVRQNEFGIFQAIGMTNKQIMKMINYENMMYTIVTSIIGIIGGSIIGVIQCLKLDELEHCITLKYPWLTVLGLIIALVIVQFILIIYGKKSLLKYSVIERVRISE